MFEQINADCANSDDQIVSLGDVEYYTDQIQNIYDVSHEHAQLLAKRMRERVLNDKALS